MTDLRLGRENRRREHYTRFPSAEMDRRLAAVRGMMRREGYDTLLAYGDAGFGTNVGYLTNYAPSSLSYFLVLADPDEPTLLFVGVGNHLQYVREVADADEVRALYPNPASRIRRRLEAAGAADGTVAIPGTRPQNGLFPYMPYGQYESLGIDLVDATVPFTEIVAVKSEPELDRIRTAAELTDLGMEVVAEEAAPGVSEADLRDALDRAYLDEVGRRATTFITSAPMADAEPGEPLPWHRPSNRRIERGDVVTTEIGAAYRGYRSQIHRPLAVGRDPTPAYEDVWDVAEATYESMLGALRSGNTAEDVYGAMAPHLESPYKMYDVMLHGYGNGILPPLIGTAESEYWPGGDDPITAAWTFEAGNVVAVQPNVVSRDERHAMQLGSVVVVRDGPPEVLQQYPVAFGRV